MHYPQGGFQSNAAGDALWNVASNLTRFTALWKEIARRYADEPAILGWDLLNEPVVTKSMNQWRDLAAETVWNIRQVDPKHLIIIERWNANKGHTGNIWDPNQNGEMNFFLLNDRNIMYEFHTYFPMAFTHQNASWIDAMKGVDSVWPDPIRVELTGDPTWSSAASGNPLIKTGTSDWTYYEGVRYTVTDHAHRLGRIALLGNNLGNGTVLADDIVLTEYAPDGSELRSMTFSFNTNQTHYYWSNPVRGSGTWSPNQGRNGSGCWKMTGSSNEAVLTDITNGLKLTQGNSWTVSGWMKGDSVPAGAQVRLRLDLCTVAGDIYVWDKSVLETELGKYVSFGERHGVPLYLGEFGCIRQTFEGGRGGLQ
jgi:endoglucanase